MFPCRLVLSAAAVMFLGLGGARAADQVKYQLGFLPSGCAANVYSASQNGMFAAENLEVTVLSGRGASDALTKVATGVADFGEVTFDALLSASAETSIPVKAIMPLYTKAPDSLMTTTTSGINSLKDVAGKRVATPMFTSSNLVWPVILKQSGVDPASVTLIKSDPNVLPGMLASGKVDAIIAWALNTAAVKPALAAAGKELKVLPWTNSGYDGYSQTVVTSSKLLAERPDVAGRFLKVMRASLIKVYENPQKAAASMKAALPQADEAMLLAQITDCQQFFFNEVTKQEGLGVFTLDRIRKSWKWVSLANNLPLDKLDPASVVDLRFSAK